MNFSKKRVFVSLILEKLKLTFGTMNNPNITLGLTDALNDAVNEFFKILINMESRAVEGTQMIQRLKCDTICVWNIDYYLASQGATYIHRVAVSIAVLILIAIIGDHIIPIKWPFTGKRIKNIFQVFRDTKITFV